jgi:hypothetical protein
MLRDKLSIERVLVIRGLLLDSADSVSDWNFNEDDA